MLRRSVWLDEALQCGTLPPMATVSALLLPRREVFRGCLLRSTPAYCSACGARSECRNDIIFDVDSMLLARQIAKYHPWACKSEDLVDLHNECVQLGEQLSQRNVARWVRHVYREFNQMADALANQSIDEPASNGSSIGW